MTPTIDLDVARAIVGGEWVWLLLILLDVINCYALEDLGAREDSKFQVDPMEVFGSRDGRLGVGLGSDEWFLEPWDQEMAPLAHCLVPYSVEPIEDDGTLSLVTQGSDTRGFHKSTIAFPEPQAEH